jgi:transcriptional regulator with XRE-family HTH domain
MMSELKDRIQKRMNALGLGQTELAAILGTKQSTVRDLLIGKNKSYRKPIELAKALETTPEWLLTGEETSPKNIDDREMQKNLEDTAKAVSLACLSAIAKLEESGRLQGDPTPALEKAINYFWADFADGTPPTAEQIQRFIISVS